MSAFKNPVNLTTWQKEETVKKKKENLFRPINTEPKTMKVVVVILALAACILVICDGSHALQCPHGGKAARGRPFPAHHMKKDTPGDQWEGQVGVSLVFVSNVLEHFNSNEWNSGIVLASNHVVERAYEQQLALLFGSFESGRFV